MNALIIESAGVLNEMTNKLIESSINMSYGLINKKVVFISI